MSAHAATPAPSIDDFTFEVVGGDAPLSDDAIEALAAWLLAAVDDD